MLTYQLFILLNFKHLILYRAKTLIDECPIPYSVDTSVIWSSPPWLIRKHHVITRITTEYNKAGRFYLLLWNIYPIVVIHVYIFPMMGRNLNPEFVRHPVIYRNLVIETLTEFMIMSQL